MACLQRAGGAWRCAVVGCAAMMHLRMLCITAAAPAVLVSYPHDHLQDSVRAFHSCIAHQLAAHRPNGQQVPPSLLRTHMTLTSPRLTTTNLCALLLHRLTCRARQPTCSALTPTSGALRGSPSHCRCTLWYHLTCWWRALKMANTSGAHGRHCRQALHGGLNDYLVRA